MNSIKKFLKLLKDDFNYLYFKEFRFKREIRRHFKKYYTTEHPKAINSKKMIIYMADGKRLHGGLSDRLRGIVTVYKYCLDHDFDFRIHFTSPFQLEEYLLPNQYNWYIEPSEISFNSKDACAVYMDKSGGEKPERELAFQKKMADKFFSLPYKQIHAYTIIYYAESEFSALFNQLFKPTSALQLVIDQNLIAIGSKFISVSARFLELLGDFKEPRIQKQLTEEERILLITKCVNKIKELKANHPECQRVLVTSDSTRFLQAAEALEYVYTIPGEITHFDVTSGKEQHGIHTKTFVDFFVIARAEKAYLMVADNMYHSTFAKRAAQVYNHPFEEITF